MKRYGRFLGTNVSELKAASRKLEKKRSIWLTVALLRLIFVIPNSLISIVSGFMHLNWKKFAISTFIGSLPRIFILSLIGWQLGSAYTSIAEKLGSIENVLFAAGILAIVAVVYFVHKKKIVRKAKKK